MTTICNNWDGPNRALPCHLPDGHDGDHEAFPGNPAGITWPQDVGVAS